MKRLLLIALTGCLGSDEVSCPDGRICPSETVCDDAHRFCVTPPQATVCVGKPDGEECTAGDIAGHCLDQICLPSICGDSVVEVGEMCDDSNTAENDMCSADCTSDRTCGNGVTDPTLGEECDDDNFLDHDGCSSQCLKERPRWIDCTLPPPERGAAGFAFDSRRGRLVVFGGRTTGDALLGDTMEWTGAIGWGQHARGRTPRYHIDGL